MVITYVIILTIIKESPSSYSSFISSSRLSITFAVVVVSIFALIVQGRRRHCIAPDKANDDVNKDRRI